MAAVAQAFGEFDPDPGRAAAATSAAWPMSAPNYNAVAPDARHHQIRRAAVLPGEVANVMRRAFSRLRNGRGGPALVEVPADLWNEEMPGPLDYTPIAPTALRPRSARVARGGADAGQGKAPGHLCRPGRALGAGLGAACANSPSCSARRSRPASKARAPSPRIIRSRSAPGGVAVPKTVRHFLDQADVIFGIGCSFTETQFRRRDAEGQDDHPRDARSRSSEQGHHRDPRARRRRRR